MAGARDPLNFWTPLDPGDRYGQAAQEFAAGAHPVSKELVLRRDDGRRSLVVAVDPRRQGRLAELFASTHPSRRQIAEGSTSWRVLHGPDPMGPLAIRLDLAFRRPVRCRVHLLFSARDELVVRHAVRCDEVCVITQAAFSELERTNRSTHHAIVLPAPPADELRVALGR